MAGSTFSNWLKGAIAIAGAATVSILWTACQQTPVILPQSPNEAPPITDEGLKLGVLLPQTGDAGQIGKPMLEVLPLLVETVNSCGGVNSAPVTLVVEDSQTSYSTAIEATIRLTQDYNVHAIVGAFASSVSNAVAEVASKEQVMVISPGSTSPVLTTRAEAGDFGLFWARTVPSDLAQARALAQVAIDRNIQTIATLSINNDYGVGFEQAFLAAFEALGGTVINKADATRYEPTATDFDEVVAETFGQTPDAVLLVAYPETGETILETAKEKQLTDSVQVLLTDAVQTEDFAETIAEMFASDTVALQDRIVGTVPGAGGMGLPQLDTLLAQRQKNAPQAFVPHTWDAAALVVLAAQAAGMNEQRAIAENLRGVSGGEGIEVSDVCQGLDLLRQGYDINYQGASGDVDLDAYGDVLGFYDIWTIAPTGEIQVIDQVSLQ